MLRLVLSGFIIEKSRPVGFNVIIYVQPLWKTYGINIMIQILMKLGVIGKVECEV